ncbi:hypothetical protein HYH03_002542 [Edaphochlamys debaryana]|uniref:Protein kinase domain-containing protein n=1 Tax=Edaphochlamys debaryana TaxID=47281 RepID=A0A836C3Y4_9CHLO|nr:hypothetical protein HYH03_002542 [Edaphochlamys debaryana]|eukprot:KAG2499601.1 hypothetical protein HYH03_002542 [Edaphochlamys debaryana]
MTNSSAAGLNAFQLQHVVDPRNVKECSALDIMAGLLLAPRELGKGTYGVVVAGTYHMVPCAVKIMVSQGLNRAAVRELLLSPSLVHPNLVATYTSRCARLTHEFFDLLEGPRIGVADPTAPRLLEPILHSGDGFGDPTGKGEAADPLPVLHQVLYDLKAVTGQVLTVTVQEFCDSTTLSNAIRRGLFLPTALWGVRLARRALLRTAAEVARGMLHLHDAGVVHGDLKPANVLLRSARDDRRGFTAKVADFGLSHVLPHAVTTISTETWGSVAYMAPEAFDGTVSRATDAWAMGVILWEMLTGERPFAGKTQPAVVQGVRTGSLSLEWPSGMDPMAEAIIALGRRCLARRPEDRPSFRAILEGVVEIELAIRAEALQQAAAARQAAVMAAAAQADDGASDGSAATGGGPQSMEEGPPQGTGNFIHPAEQGGAPTLGLPHQQGLQMPHGGPWAANAPPMAQHGPPRTPEEAARLAAMQHAGRH